MGHKLWRVATLFSAVATMGAVSAQDAPTPAQNNDIRNQDFVVDQSNRMTVPVRVNGSEPLPFIIDTGAERTVIAHDLAQQLALKSGRQLTLATVTGPAQVSSYLITNLSTDTVSIADLEAPGLERQNLGAYGLLGIDSLEDHKVLLDFKASKMDVLASPKQKKRTNKTQVEKDMIIVTAVRRAGRMILSNARIGNMNIDIILDTGAQSSMGNSALRKRLRGSQRLFGFTPATMRSVTGESLAGEFTQIRSINVGGMEIAGLPVTFADNYAFDALDLNKRPAILLGMDAMALFDRVLIDFANRRVGFDLPKGVAPTNWLRQGSGDLQSTGSILNH